jgi:hypothetical protein
MIRSALKHFLALFEASNLRQEQSTSFYFLTKCFPLEKEAVSSGFDIIWWSVQVTDSSLISLIHESGEKRRHLIISRSSSSNELKPVCFPWIKSLSLHPLVNLLVPFSTIHEDSHRQRKKLHSKPILIEEKSLYSLRKQILVKENEKPATRSTIRELQFFVFVENLVSTQTWSMTRQNVYQMTYFWVSFLVYPSCYCIKSISILLTFGFCRVVLKRRWPQSLSSLFRSNVSLRLSK